MTTDTTTDTGRLTIDGLLVEGKYRTRESYTEAQTEELLEIAEKAGKAAVRDVCPDLVDQVVVERFPGAPFSRNARGVSDATVRLVGSSVIFGACATAIVITLTIKLL